MICYWKMYTSFFQEIMGAAEILYWDMTFPPSAIKMQVKRNLSSAWLLRVLLRYSVFGLDFHNPSREVYFLNCFGAWHCLTKTAWSLERKGKISGQGNLDIKIEWPPCSKYIAINIYLRFYRSTHMFDMCDINFETSAQNISKLSWIWYTKINFKAKKWKRCNSVRRK